MLGMTTGKSQEDFKSISSFLVDGNKMSLGWATLTPRSSSPHLRYTCLESARLLVRSFRFTVHEKRRKSPRSPGNLALVRHLRAAVSHVEVDNILSVSPLHRNSKGLKGMEGKGDETPHCVADGAAQEACLDLKLEQTRVAGIEPKQKEREKEREGGRDTHQHRGSA